MKRNILFILAFILFLNADLSKPKVLIIGDSISGGYYPFVKEMLRDEAIVYKNEGNARYTGIGLIEIENWLGDDDWDVIHFNWGLWDIYGWRYMDSIRTPEVYAENLEILVSRLEETGAELIWATTTPVCPEPEWNDSVYISSRLERKYRKAALRVMRKHDVRVNDLYRTMKPRQKEYAVGNNDVHFTAGGSEFLAAQVAKYIKESLKND